MEESKKIARALLTRHGIWVVLLLAVPVIAILSFQPEVKVRFRPHVVTELPGAAAVRSDLGPPALDAAGVPVPEVAHVRTPEFVKGIYLTAMSAGYKKRFDHLVEFVDKSEINSMVIDLKDGVGGLAFDTTGEELKPYEAKYRPLGSLRDFTKPLHDKGIYLIARVFVFQDPWFVDKHPELAVKGANGKPWEDRKGVKWLDPAELDVWKYNVAVAREAYAGGFDEVQFDYIRFLTDGRTNEAVFPAWDGKMPKHEVINSFFNYVDHELRQKSGIPISADLFGLTMWDRETDLNIGQRLQDAGLHFDFVSPMVYPSHYPAGYTGYANPAKYPYEVVYKNMVRGQETLEKLSAESGAPVAKVRPWLQDFNLGAVYTPEMVKAQMKASTDGNVSGWIFWNAGNVYTESAYAPDVK